MQYNNNYHRWSTLAWGRRSLLRWWWSRWSTRRARRSIGPWTIPRTLLITRGWTLVGMLHRMMTWSWTHRRSVHARRSLLRWSSRSWSHTRWSTRHSLAGSHLPLRGAHHHSRSMILLRMLRMWSMLMWWHISLMSVVRSRTLTLLWRRTWSRFTLRFELESSKFTHQ